ncbi:SIR2 family NAD-dependent protein deacylase [Luteimonas saliphila]|uniref:SIR2 family NAD-dependent protein deacylase n=1 Tax=Luteimonas saliphila TaxID=2804919 RepID=UPI00192D2E8D|nr:NAD-dependent deacylase [Luteimonas saliphila]
MRIAFLTGAGMSAESGVPTFRDALTGLWSRYDAMTLATEDAFRRDPALVWGWYRWRAAMVRRARPNAGHFGIAEFVRSGHAVEVVTQNVDDLHERGGMREAIHLHGRLFASRCLDCGATREPDPIVDGLDAIVDGVRETPPACDACGGPFRPGVVWFGEALPEDAWASAVAVLGRCELLVVVGTSGLVHPAASLPRLASTRGTRVIEINPVDSAVSPLAHECLRMPAGAGIRILLERYA